ncbi:hypothetical protein DENSPDRAFT_862008 [Dentipellis sp. KUC8613]|nr:hypothetical protein DENSPDRAFT_862008 [Dentipellis sp. KUC8613]
MDWEVARWAKEEAVGSNALTRLLSIPGLVDKLDLSYQNSRALNQIVDELPGNPPWLESSFTVSHEDTGSVTHKLRFRDPLKCIESLYGKVDFVNHMSFGPVKDFCDEERSQQMYGEMNTGSWWWETQGKLPDGATVVPVILSSDKTQLSVFSGDQEVHPVYLTIGNISKDIRRKPSYRAQILIAYLPIADLAHLSDDAARVIRARMFHEAMTVVLKTLVGVGRTGTELTSGDGAVRKCFPIVAVYVADHPEQCLICCTRFGQQCPKCSAAVKDFGDHKLESWERRKQKDTLRTLRKASKLPSFARHEAVLKDAGLTHTVNPFWASLPFCNIHDTISPDILHQLIQGMIKHLIQWVTAIVGTVELDARLKCLPEAHGVRHFVNGISGLSQVTGPERKEICKQLLGCLVGKAPSRAIRATRALLDFLFIAQYQSHSDDTLGYLEDTLAEFHQHKSVFLEESARIVPNFNLPKLHMLEHYVPGIKSIGTTDNSNTEFTERLHIDNAKHAYDATNKKANYVEQMTVWLDRQERIALFDARLRWLLKDPPSMPRTRSRRARILPVGPSFPKTPSAPSVSFQAVASSYHAPNFVHVLRSFIASYRCQTDKERTAARRRNHDNLVIPFNHVDIWHRVSFAVKNIQLDTEPNLITAVMANPNHHGGVGRFDTVIIATDKAEDTGMNGLRIARVRVLFRLPSDFNAVLFTDYDVSPPGHLAFVEWFSPPASRKHDHQMYTVTHKCARADVSIIEVKDIRRNCQLIPIFGERADRAWTKSNVLDRCEGFYVNNFQDHHAYQSLW